MEMMEKENKEMVQRLILMEFVQSFVCEGLFYFTSMAYPSLFFASIIRFCHIFLCEK